MTSFWLAVDNLKVTVMLLSLFGDMLKVLVLDNGGLLASESPSYRVTESQTPKGTQYTGGL